jgi:hypothetical protein
VKTIIQTIGPLYGEVVNGTVFGQPNGSIAVPSNPVPTLDVKVIAANQYVKGIARDGGGYDWVTCNADGVRAGVFWVSYVSPIEGCRIGITLDGKGTIYNDTVTRIDGWDTDHTTHDSAPAEGTEYPVVITLYGPYFDVLDTSTVTLTRVVIE